MSLVPGWQVDQPGRRADAIVDGRFWREHLAPGAGTPLAGTGSWHACCPSLARPETRSLHLGESASAEASPLTHRGLQTAPVCSPAGIRLLHLGASCKGKHSVVRQPRGEKGQFFLRRSAPWGEHTLCDGPSAAAVQQDSCSGCLQLGVSALDSATHSGTVSSSLRIHVASIYSAAPRNTTHSTLCVPHSSPYEALTVVSAFWRRGRYSARECNLPTGMLPVIGTNGIQMDIYLTSKA